MFSLVTERGKYLRVRKNVSKDDVVATYKIPVGGEFFCGRIIALGTPKRYCYAEPDDTYEKIAEREGADAEELKTLNGNTAVYPTRRIWLP